MPRAFRLLALSSSVVFAVAAGAACHAEPDDLPPPGKAAPAPKKMAAAPPCNAKDDPALTAVYENNFESPDLPAEVWNSTSYGAYVVKSGRVCTSKPKNHPLWLRRKLPTNVRVEFDATPLTNNADVKAELFGDGCMFDVEGKDYLSTGYVGVLGAHNNTEHWLARLYEHGSDLKKTVLDPASPTIDKARLAANTSYHVEMSRTDGRTLTLVVNAQLVHTFEDGQPLQGAGHDHFAFNGWEAAVCFDNLKVTPL